MAKEKKRSKFRDQVSDNARRQKSQGKGGFPYLSLPKGIKLFKEEPGGKALLDFIPYEVTDERHPDRNPEKKTAMPGELWYRRPFKVHNNVGSDNEKLLCPSTFGKKCPICEYSAKRLKEGAEWEEVADIRPSLRNLYVVIPRGMDKFEERLYIWNIAQSLFQKPLNEELDDDPDLGVFPDPEEGLSLRIRFEKKTRGKAEWAETSRIDFKERKEAIDEDLLKKVPNLDEIFVLLSYKEIYTKFFENIEAPGEEEEEEEKPKKKADPDPDPDDDDDKPKKKKKKEEEEDDKPARRQKTVDPDDDDDRPKRTKKPKEEETEEEEEEKPKKKGPPCVACEGSGKNSKGSPCPTCKGTGRKPKKEEEKAEEEEKPKRTKKPHREEEEEEEEEEKPKKKAKKDDSVQECPHDYKFGKECEDHDECTDCKLWGKCIEAKEADD